MPETGGQYVPKDNICLAASQVEELNKLPFRDCAAAVLNHLLNTNLSGWDIDFSVGRTPARLAAVGQKIVIGEFWHNSEGLFSTTVHNLAEALEVNGENTWLEIAVRCAFICASLAELKRSGAAEQGVDIAVPASELTEAASAWYAREMGFPIRRILCCCNENNSFWELLHNGQIRTDAVAVATELPLADVQVPRELERILWHLDGQGACASFLECCRMGKAYVLTTELSQKLNAVFGTAVVGKRRISDTISGLYGSSGYILSPYAAMCFAGLEDDRAAIGEQFPALILSERSPEKDRRFVAEALGIPENILNKQLQ